MDVLPANGVAIGGVRVRTYAGLELANDEQDVQSFASRTNKGQEMLSRMTKISAVLLSAGLILAMLGCDSSPNKSERMQAAQSAVKSFDGYGVIWDSADIRLTNASKIDDNHYRVDFEFDQRFLGSPEEISNRVKQEVNAQASGKGASLASALTMSAMAMAADSGILTMALRQKYGDFKRGSINTSGAWVALTRTERGWIYQPAE